MRLYVRLHCAKCNKDYLLAFSCKGRWWRLPCIVPEGLWCTGPSCHQKTVLLFGEFIKESVAYPLPHRQYVFSMPKMLRVYFRNNRELLKRLCQIANECLLEYLRQLTRQPEGQLGMVMTIHTFGEYMGYNCHLHALVADGLFSERGMFYVAPRLSTKPLEQLFRVRVIKMLVDEGLLAGEMARKLLSWHHSGFSVHNGKPIKRGDDGGLERVAQYIIRNPFSEKKMTYNEESGMVIYRSRKRANTKRNFEVFSAQDFIAAITQHIPDKGFQMVRYYGWYSNRARGDRAKRAAEGEGADNSGNVEVIDVSDYQPRRLPSKKWRELIKKVWEIDPMNCPRCGCEMKKIALIDESQVIEKILRHLGLWSPAALPVRAPPAQVLAEYIHEPFFEDLSFEPAVL